MAVRNERTRGSKDASERRSPSGLFEKAFNGGAPMFSEALDMLKSDRMDDRLKGMGVMLKLAIDGDDRKAKKELLGNCRKAIASKEKDERVAVRKVLAKLAMEMDCAESKKMLEVDYLQTIHDFDLQALVYLGMHGSGSLSREVDAVLESEFESIYGKENLDAIAYIAAMSTCSLEVRRKAARIAARLEKRVGNLAFIRDTAGDEEISAIMAQELQERGVSDSETVEDDSSYGGSEEGIGESPDMDIDRDADRDEALPSEDEEDEDAVQELDFYDDSRRYDDE